MLTIRADQMQMLRDASRTSFERRAADHLMQSFPEKCDRIITAAAGLTLVGLVREGITKAKSYGLSREADVTRFLEVLVLTWPDLEEHPAASWAKAILADRDISALRQNGNDSSAIVVG